VSSDLNSLLIWQLRPLVSLKNVKIILNIGGSQFTSKNSHEIIDLYNLKPSISPIPVDLSDRSETREPK
jgi:hypothetical protein